jgi:hypothetical protein
MSETNETKTFHVKKFRLLKDAPVLPRASGDSGFVAHLSSCTHGATGWDWSFRLVKPGHGWAFVSDGKLSLFLDEPGQYVPADAKPQDLVAVRMPRARDNIHPHRFTLLGGQGGAVTANGFTKLFLPVSYEAAPALVEAFSSRWADQLRFTLVVSNAPQDFERADAAVLDVAKNDEGHVVHILETFMKSNSKGFGSSKSSLPFGTQLGPLSLPVAHGVNKSDLADAFGWRVSREAAR